MENLNRDRIRFFRHVWKCSLRECIYAFVLLYLVLSFGCASHKQAQAMQQKAAVEESSTDDAGISQAMQIALDVLGKMHFEIEKADVKNGYIRTRPLAGGQFFEFWRSDNVGLKNQLLSNLHSIRRIVELNLTMQAGEPGIDCEVHVQRLSLPQHEITSSAQAYQMFTRSSVSLQRLEMHPEQEAGKTWVDLDDDKKLEEEILKRISSMISRENKEKGSEVKTAKEKL
jgi:uncharacterized protein YcfL